MSVIPYPGIGGGGGGCNWYKRGKSLKTWGLNREECAVDREPCAVGRGRWTVDARRVGAEVVLASAADMKPLCDKRGKLSARLSCGTAMSCKEEGLRCVRYRASGASLAGPRRLCPSTSPVPKSQGPGSSSDFGLSVRRPTHRDKAAMNGAQSRFLNECPMRVAMISELLPVCSLIFLRHTKSASRTASIRA